MDTEKVKVKEMTAAVEELQSLLKEAIEGMSVLIMNGLRIIISVWQTLLSVRALVILNVEIPQTLIQQVGFHQ